MIGANGGGRAGHVVEPGQHDRPRSIVCTSPALTCQKAGDVGRSGGMPGHDEPGGITAV